jgi:hypothetical protein
VTSPAPLTLVVGVPADAAQRALARWLADRPGEERWAVLANAGSCPLPGQGDRVGFFELPAACPCCAAALALRSAFGRVQRAGPWQRLFLLLPAAAHAAASVDALRTGLSAHAFRLDSVIALVDARRPPAWLDAAAGGSEAARALAEIATLVVVDGDSESQRGRLARLLADGALGARPVLHAQAGVPGWDVAQGAASLPPGPGVLRWPSEAIFDRARLQRVLAGLDSREPGLAMRGVFRTARDWYRWDPGDSRPWAPTHWRLDSRLKCALTDTKIITNIDVSVAATIELARSATA